MNTKLVNENLLDFNAIEKVPVLLFLNWVKKLHWKVYQ